MITAYRGVEAQLLLKLQTSIPRGLQPCKSWIMLVQSMASGLRNEIIGENEWTKTAALEILLLLLSSYHFSFLCPRILWRLQPRNSKRVYGSLTRRGVENACSWSKTRRRRTGEMTGWCGCKDENFWCPLLREVNHLYTTVRYVKVKVPLIYV